jgi:hypothetical protein
MAKSKVGFPVPPPTNFGSLGNRRGISFNLIGEFNNFVINLKGIRNMLV